MKLIFFDDGANGVFINPEYVTAVRAHGGFQDGCNVGVYLAGQNAPIRVASTSIQKVAARLMKPDPRDMETGLKEPAKPLPDPTPVAKPTPPEVWPATPPLPSTLTAAPDSTANEQTNEEI